MGSNSHRSDLGSEAQSMWYRVPWVCSFSLPYLGRKEETVALRAATEDYSKAVSRGLNPLVKIGNASVTQTACFFLLGPAQPRPPLGRRDSPAMPQPCRPLSLPPARQPHRPRGRCPQSPPEPYRSPVTHSHKYSRRSGRVPVNRAGWGGVGCLLPTVTSEQHSPAPWGSRPAGEHCLPPARPSRGG